MSMGDDNKDDDNSSKKLIQSPSSTSSEDIPDVLWEQIFSAVLHDGNHRSLQPISLACKRFLALSNNTLTSLTLSPSRPAEPLYSRFPFINTIKLYTAAQPNLDATITQLAHSNLRLKSLILHDQTHFPKDAMRLLSQRMSKTLTSLSCTDFNNLDDADLDSICDFFPNLQKLNIEGSRRGGEVTDEGIWTISTKLNSLISLNIADQRHLSYLSIEYLSENLPLLQDLTAESYDDRYFFLDQFIHFTSLTSLSLVKVVISEEMLDELAEANLKLRSLFLYFPICLLDVKGTSLCRFFESLESLHHLHLKRFRFPADMTATDFALSIPSVQILEFIDSYFEEGASQSTLFQLLKNCRLLEEITTCCTNPKPLKDWFDKPFRCNLKKLDLIMSKSLYDQTLALICSVCPKLESVLLRGCPDITQEGIEALKASCANLKYLFVDGCGKIPHINWKKED